MDPNLPQNQSVGLADLSSTTNPMRVNLQSSAPVTAAAPSMAPSAGQQTTEQAKRLVQQYSRDPFKLSSAFSELKQQHLVEQYQITPNPVDR